MTNQNLETQISVIRNNIGLLCCPECRGELSFGDETRRNEASLGLQNYLSCHSCNHVFPIINGVVVFDERELVQEAISFSWIGQTAASSNFAFACSWPTATETVRAAAR